MPDRWTRFVNPSSAELREWFSSAQAEDLSFHELHPVARAAIENCERQFSEPFPRIESHGHYVFGMLAVPTSVEDEREDFCVVHFLASLEQVVTIVRSAPSFNASEVQAEIEEKARQFETLERSVGLAIAKVAEVFVSRLELALDDLRNRIEPDLQLVTGESRQIPSNADPEDLSRLYGRTALYMTEISSLATVVQETKNVLKEITSDRVDVRGAESSREDLFPPRVEISMNDLLMRTRHLTSLRDNLEADVKLMFERFQEIQNTQQTASSRKMTGVLSILLLPQLIAGYFGQNFDQTPGYKEELGWLYSLALILIVSAGQFYWFKKKRYL
jgi:Mg2+ and Co2+ transporter CorA